MMVLGAVILAVLSQWGYNRIAEKRGYGFEKKMQWLAILLNAFFWGYLVYKQGHVTPSLIFACLATSLLISVIFVDFRHYIIPNGYSLLMFLFGIGYVFTQLSQWKNLLLGGVAAFATFLMLMILSRGNLGFGDVKLSAGIGLFVGIKGIMLYVAYTFLLGAVVSFALLMLKMKGRKDKIAFGPYMAIVFLLILL